MLRLVDFDAITFDVYGTLIDWEPSIIAYLRLWAERKGIVSTDVELLMTFDRARAAIQKERPAHLYPDVLRRCFDRIASEYHVTVDSQDRETFALSPREWPGFPDSRAGLNKLQAHAKIGALSNIDNASLKSSCAKLHFAFDVVVTAERIGAYKPDHKHFETVIADLAMMGIPRERILHVGQSLRADVTPANKLGLKCAWINRPHRLLGLSGEGAAEARPNLTVASVQELVAALSPGK